MRKRILSIALTLCMVLSLVPLTPIAVVATTTTTTTTTSAKDITLGYAALHNADTANAKWDYVYFGTYSDSPIKWRVLSTEGNNTTVGTSTDTATYKTADGAAYTGNALFMLSENTLGSYTAFGTDNKYQGSKLQTVMKGIFPSDSKELKYVLKTTKTDSSETIGYINSYNNNQYSITWGGSGLSEDILFALSAREVAQYLGTKCSNHISGNAAWWWLRSPCSGRNDNAGVIVDYDGFVDFDNVGLDLGVRPALNLNSSKIL